MCAPLFTKTLKKKQNKTHIHDTVIQEKKGVYLLTLFLFKKSLGNFFLRGKQSLAILLLLSWRY